MAEDRRALVPEKKRNPKLSAAGSATRGRNRGRRFLREIALGAILTIVPLLLSVIVILSLVVAQQRASALDALARRAKATAEEVDRIWAGHTTTLMRLAGSPALARGDLEGFEAEARRARDLEPHWLTVIVSDPASGQQLLNLMHPDGALRVFPDLASHAQVVATRKPVAVANSSVDDPISGGPAFAILVPAVREGGVSYVLAVALRRETLDRALATSDLPPGWSAAVIDAKGATAACVRCPEATAGEAARAAISERVGGVGAALLTGQNGSIQSFVALARADLSGWSVAIGMPIPGLTNIFLKEVWIIAPAALVCALAALLAIAWLAKRRLLLQRLLDKQVGERTAELRASERRYAALSNATHEGVAIYSRGRIVEANASFAAMFGYSPDELVHKPPLDLAAPEAREDVAARFGREEPFELVGLRKDGSRFPVALRARSIEYQGRLMQVGVLRDLTEEKAAEERVRALQAELLHFSRLTDLAQLAAALAHELNQPLAAVALYVSACRRLIDSSKFAMPDLGKVRRAMELAGDQALRAGEIINRVRRLMAKGEVERRIENAAEILQEAAALALATAASRGVIVRLSFETSAKILVDKIQIQQVLINLVRNAVEAMEESPRKVIEIRVAETSGSVETSVSDTGIGLPTELADRLFEPFSSTKSHGMGIGLHLCRNIVAAHDGQIWAEPRTGGGSVFRFTIPIVDPILRADPAEEPRAVAAR